MTDPITTNEALKMVQETLQEVSHTAKVLCHENESLKREIASLLGDVKILSGRDVRIKYREGVQFLYSGVWICGEEFEVFCKAGLKHKGPPYKPKPDPDEADCDMCS